MIYTIEELFKTADEELKKNNEWKVKKCNICNGIDSVYVDDEDTFYQVKNHSSCHRIRKYEKLSIFDKDSEKNTFKNSVSKNKKEDDFVEKFIKYCSNFEKAKENGVGLLLTGNAGTGKTFYSNCIANDLKSKGFTVLSFNLTNYLNELRNFEDNNREKELLGAIKDVDFIVVDDVGNEKLTDWGKEKMFGLFNEIYMNKKSCVITTNLNKNQLEKHFLINDSNKIIDRIMELCKAFIFDWESRRTEIGKEKFKDIF